MSFSLRLCLFWGLGALACPAWAAGEEATQVGLTLQEGKNEDFLKKYLGLPEAERGEAFAVLMTEMAGTEVVRTLPKALFEDESAAYPRPLKKSLVEWLSQPPSDKDYENLRYIGLASRPADVKLKIEKAACEPERKVSSAEIAAVVRPSIVRRALCAMKTRTPLLYWALVVPAVMELAFDFDPCARASAAIEPPVVERRLVGAKPTRCADQVALSLAVVHADGEMREETLVRGSSFSLAGGLDAVEWRSLRRKVWESAERLLTSGEDLPKTLGARLRVLEILPDPDPSALERRRKLVVFTRSAADAPDPRQDYCGWAEAYSRAFKDADFARGEASCAGALDTAAAAPPVVADAGAAESPAVEREPAAATKPAEPLPDFPMAAALVTTLRGAPSPDLPGEAAKLVLATPESMWKRELDRAEARAAALERGAGAELSEAERVRHLDAARALRDELRRRLK
jgi:hypothetical protein